MTRGRRMLLGLLQRTTGSAISARCRVSFQLVSGWANGYYKPSAASRAALQQNYGIPCEAWDLAWRNPVR